MKEHAITPAGNRYMTIFVILRSRYVLIYLHSKKSDFPRLIEKAITQMGRPPRIFRTDEALEYAGKESQAIYTRYNIVKQTTNAHQQFQNGPSEKMGHTILNGV